MNTKASAIIIFIGLILLDFFDDLKDLIIEAVHRKWRKEDNKN